MKKYEIALICIAFLLVFSNIYSIIMLKEKDMLEISSNMIDVLNRTEEKNNYIIIDNDKRLDNLEMPKSDLKDIFNKIEVRNKANSTGIETNNIVTEDFKTLGVLEIPKINLNEIVKEGISNNVIDKYIGHFQNTSLWYGNIGLCAHNRGYEKNHFSNLKKLEIGDEVIYKTKYGIRKYKVNIIKSIKAEEIEELENSEENKLTMITCITGKPNKRLCVQAIEVK